MESIKLSNQVEMPMEGFGVFQVEEQACEQVVLDAIASGYRLIDTASSYQNEEAVGRAIRSCGVPWGMRKPWQPSKNLWKSWGWIIWICI